MEPEAVEAGATAERDVGLAVGESAAAEVDPDAFKGLSLGFVDRDRPGELHGILFEHPVGYSVSDARCKIYELNDRI